MTKKIKVGCLGATGVVGQNFVKLLANHPWFELTELVASNRSAGNKYCDIVNWHHSTPPSPEIANMVVKSVGDKLESQILFSALDSSIAGEIESEMAIRGHYVFSNSKNHRMNKDVPLIIPEINGDHLELINTQQTKGAIITNPNCSTIILSLAIAPLQMAIGIEKISVTTMQAVSGAGHPGVASLDILGNIIPFISEEEDKIESETKKIFGKLATDEIIYDQMIISAQCNRVPVIDGHLLSISVKLKQECDIDEIEKIIKSFRPQTSELKLPSSLPVTIELLKENNRPQVKMDLHKNNGMGISIGRLKKCKCLDYRFVALGHNTIRGAAGASILNAEYLVANNYLKN